MNHIEFLRMAMSALLLVLVLIGIGGGISVTSAAAQDNDTANVGTTTLPNDVRAQNGNPLLSRDVFPIGLWWPPPPAETTVERYRELAETGINFVIGGNGVFDRPFNQLMLQAAEANDLVAIVVDYRLRVSADIDDAQMRESVQQVLADYEQYPAFAGLSLYDEPHADMFAGLGKITRLIEQYSPDTIAYINLFPTYASPNQLGTHTYQEHVDRFIAETDPQVLSFDHYPLVASGGETAMTLDYFRNWKIIREAALEADIPPWIFIQSVSYNSRRHPKEAEILWQVNVSLAYGAKGIMYFTYWTPGVGSDEGFGPALISLEGEQTELYHAAKRVNQELSAVGGELLPLVSESVVHAGEALASRLGVDTFSPNGWIAGTNGDAVILGQYRERTDETDESAGNRRWVLVANRFFHKTGEVTLTFDESIRSWSRFNAETGEYEQIGVRDENTDAPGEMSISLQPGAAKLLLLDK